MRIAIIGGGIAGLTAAWELQRMARPGLRVSLFESSSRLGGVIQTVREGGFVIETGPDAWLTAKPWASELARDLGLAEELLPSNDAARRTWIYLNQRLVPMPEGMTLMVPGDLDALSGSTLFSPQAIAAYRDEPVRAAELLAAIPAEDESVASFTLRHFGPEVLERIAAPLLSGVFGGDVHTLSARAALPALIALERSHGSLVAGVRAQTGLHQNSQPGSAQPLFTSLRSGVGTLTDRLIAQIPPAWLRLNTAVLAIAHAPGGSDARGQAWQVTSSFAGQRSTERFDRVLLALPSDAARALLAPVDCRCAALLLPDASSAVLVAYAFPDASRVPIPPGFGLLVPPNAALRKVFHAEPDDDTSAARNPPSGTAAQRDAASPMLLQACTFVDQKFAHRVPPGGRLLRAFFGGAAATRLAACNNDEIAAIGRSELARVLHSYTHAMAPLSGPMPTPLPEPLITAVQRLPRSLPQYSVGHLERAAELGGRLASTLPGLTLLGNSLHGLGIPDVIRDARRAAREIADAP